MEGLEGTSLMEGSIGRDIVDGRDGRKGRLEGTPLMERRLEASSDLDVVAGKDVGMVDQKVPR